MELVPFYIRPAISPELCGHKVILFQGVVTEDVPFHDFGLTPFPLTLLKGATGNVGVMTSARRSISHSSYVPSDSKYPYIVTNVTIAGTGKLASYVEPQDGPLKDWWSYPTPPNVIFSNRVSGSSDITLRLYNSGDFDLDIPAVSTEISHVFRYASCVKMVPWYFDDIHIKGLVDAHVGSSGSYEPGLTVTGRADVDGHVERVYVREPTTSLEDRVDRHYALCGNYAGEQADPSNFECDALEELLPDETLAAVRCCTDVQSQSMIDAGWERYSGCDVYAGSDEGWTCQTSEWKDAKDFCATTGGRLCTKEEIKAGCGRSSGCSYDRTLVWTSTDFLEGDSPGSPVDFQLRAGKTKELVSSFEQPIVCANPKLSLVETLQKGETSITGYLNDTAKIVEVKTDFLTEMSNNITSINQYDIVHLPLKGAPTWIEYNYQGIGTLATRKNGPDSLWSMWEVSSLGVYVPDHPTLSLTFELISNRYRVAKLQSENK